LRPVAWSGEYIPQQLFVFVVSICHPVWIELSAMSQHARLTRGPRGDLQIQEVNILASIRGSLCLHEKREGLS
jgi:hypothetical protein